MVELSPQPPIRCWYLDESGNQLIQIQNNRFIHNWRKTTDETLYPHYENIRPHFETEWARFLEFVKQEQLGNLEPSLCEVCYVNHFEKGREWSEFSELPKIFPFWAPVKSGNFLASPNAVAIHAQYPLPEQKGRLTIKVEPAVRRANKEEVIQFTLSAKGKPASPATEEIAAWFDLGREFVVQAFCELTSPSMHKQWKRRS